MFVIKRRGSAGRKAAGDADKSSGGGTEQDEAQQKQKRMGVAEMEQKAGRVGGGKGPQIFYDDAALEELLNRCALCFPLSCWISAPPSDRELDLMSLTSW